MTLGQAAEEEKKPVAIQEQPIVKEKEMEAMEAALQAEEPEVDYLMPKLVEEIPVQAAPVIDFSDIKAEEEAVVVHFELKPDTEILLSNTTGEPAGTSTVGKMSIVGKDDSINSAEQKPSVPQQTIKETDAELILSMKDSTSSTSPVSAASGGYLARPSNIYAASQAEETTSKRAAEEPVLSAKTTASEEEEELLDLQMQIVERDDIPAADMPLAHQAQTHLTAEVEDPTLLDETEEQKRRAAERLHKLRNLSFNVNAADPNNEFETVPAYIRRNMELYNSNTQVENFYSNYEVKKDEKNQIFISEFNKFLDGKKPD